MSSSLDLILGPVQIGYSVATLLFGLVTIQSFTYFQEFPNDPLPLKVLVTVVWIIEFSHQMCCIRVIYYFLITSFGTLTILDAPPPKAHDAIILLSSTTALLVQSFFALRLWRATKKTVILAFFSVLITARFAISMALSGIAFRMTSLAAYLIQIKWLMTIAWSIGATTDILMTLALCYDLHRRRRSAIYRTARLIDRLIIWTVATGVLTSITALSMIICFLTLNHTLVWEAIYITLSRFFSNSMMVSLNARSNLRRFDARNTVNSVLSRVHVDALDDSPLAVLVTETVTNTKDTNNQDQNKIIDPVKTEVAF